MRLWIYAGSSIRRSFVNRHSFSVRGPPIANRVVLPLSSLQRTLRLPLHLRFHRSARPCFQSWIRVFRRAPVIHLVQDLASGWTSRRRLAPGSSSPRKPLVPGRVQSPSSPREADRNGQMLWLSLYSKKFQTQVTRVRGASMKERNSRLERPPIKSDGSEPTPRRARRSSQTHAKAFSISKTTPSRST